MGYTNIEQAAAEEQQQTGQSTGPRHNYVLHGILFVLTFFSVAWSSSMFLVMPDMVPEGIGVLDQITYGLPYAVLLILFLSAHEFGHYIAARYHGVDATLPYYIPMPLFLFGTMGAVIRIRSAIPSRKALFDIGVAGPLAGFVVALAYLIIGMATMPGIESLYVFHPEYRELAAIPDAGIHFGSFLLYDALKALFTSPEAFFPPSNELYHYPFLGAGWFGMFVTALNMLPIGQLDGGHILYSMFGTRQAAISRWALRFLLVCGLGGLAAVLYEVTGGYEPNTFFRTVQEILRVPLEFINQYAPWYFRGWPGWLLWVVLLRILMRPAHPPTMDDRPIGRARMIIGWISLAILVLTFSFTAIY